MDRYLLFAGDNYYPDGGWDDFRGSFSCVSDAVLRGVGYLQAGVLDKGHANWFHVVDAADLQMAFTFDWQGAQIK